MEILGKVKGGDVVLTRDDGAQALKMVDALPVAPGETESHAVQLRIDAGGYKRGDIFVFEGAAWRKVDVPTATVGSVSSIICPRVNQDVQIRWLDPEDRSPYTWKHTRLLRKFGEYPKDVFDGVIVTDSYIRNQYNTSMFHDYVPAGTENDWYYRFFTFSEDEVSYTDDSCKFQPIELSWKTLNKIVQDGLATKVFALGDAVTITPKDAYKYDPFYKSLTFSVAGFNTASMEDLTKVYSITFVLSHTFGDYMTRWDKLWEQYQLTTDIYVTDRTKVYYVKDPDKGWTEVTNLPLGKKLEPNTYYEKNTDVDRQQHGGNKWANCALRAWLNSTGTEESDKWTFEDASGNTIKVVPPLTAMDPDVVEAITSVRNKNALPIGADRASSDYAMSIDKLYLLSMKEVFDKNAVYSWFQITSDITPCKYGVTEDTVRNKKKNYFIYLELSKAYRKAISSDFNKDGSFKTGVTYHELYYYIFDSVKVEYRLALADDYTEANEFKEGVTYYEKMISDIAENNYLPYFDDEELEPRVMRNSASLPCSWWLRSANILTTTKVRTVSTGGELQEGDHSYKTLGTEKIHHVVFAFTVA